MNPDENTVFTLSSPFHPVPSQPLTVIDSILWSGVSPARRGKENGCNRKRNKLCLHNSFSSDGQAVPYTTAASLCSQDGNGSTFPDQLEDGHATHPRH